MSKIQLNVEMFRELPPTQQKWLLDDFNSRLEIAFKQHKREQIQMDTVDDAYAAILPYVNPDEHSKQSIIYTLNLFFEKAHRAGRREVTMNEAFKIAKLMYK